LEKVLVKDLETKTKFLIPACELAPGMVCAREEGEEGEFFVQASQIKAGTEYFHPPFDDDMRKIMVFFRDTFTDVYSQTAEEWEDGFRRDMHPNREIEIWVNMARVFLHFTEGRDLSPEQKRDILQVILACSHAGLDHVHALTSPVTLSRKRVRQIAKVYGTAPDISFDGWLAAKIR
jgi:hypothetical protein